MRIGLSLGVNQPRAALAGGGGEFDPLAISWKAAFWASDPLWTPPANGAGVSSWRDAGSEAKNLVQASGSEQPLFTVSVAALNDQPALTMDANVNFRDMQTATWDTSITGHVTWVVVGNATITTFDRAGMIASKTAGHFMGPNSGQWQFQRGDTQTGGTADFDGHLFYVSAGLAAGGTMEVDGTQVASGTAQNEAMTGLFMGRRSSGAGYFGGNVAFVGVYDGTLPSGDYDDLKQWASTFYGLTVV